MTVRSFCAPNSSMTQPEKPEGIKCVSNVSSSNFFAEAVPGMMPQSPNVARLRSLRLYGAAVVMVNKSDFYRLADDALIFNVSV